MADCVFSLDLEPKGQKRLGTSLLSLDSSSPAPAVHEAQMIIRCVSIKLFEWMTVVLVT